MIPFERDVYKSLLINHLKEEAERAREEAERHKAMQSTINSRNKSKGRRR